MIKVANNLQRLCRKQAAENGRTKQALLFTTLSALLHGAAADDDEPMFRELLRGGAKGLAADVGTAAGLGLGGLLGARVGWGVSADTDAMDRAFYRTLEANNPNDAQLAAEDFGRNSASAAKGTAAGLGLGALLGGAGGGIGSYLLADKIIDNISKKKPKVPRPPLAH